MQVWQKIEYAEDFEDVNKICATRLYNSFNIVLNLCRVLGISLFNKRKQGNNKIILNTSVNNWMVFLIYITIYLIMLLYHFKILMAEEFQSNMLKSFMFIYSLFLALTTTVLLLLRYKNRKMLIEYIDSIGKLDKLFEILDIKIDHLFLRKLSSSLLTVTLIITCSKCASIMFIWKLNFIQFLLLIVISLIHLMANLQYFIFIATIAIRFHAMSSLLKSNITLNSYGNICITDKIHILYYCFSKLSKIIDKMTATYAIENFTMCLVILVNSLMQLSFYYILFTRNIESYKFLKLAVVILWMIETWYEGISIMKICSDTSEYARNVAVDIHALDRRIKDNNLQKHVESYSLQLLLEKIKFSVLDFFELDFVLFYMLVGTFITFLIALVQFDQEHIIN